MEKEVLISQYRRLEVDYILSNRGQRRPDYIVEPVCEWISNYLATFSGELIGSFDETNKFYQTVVRLREERNSSAYQYLDFLENILQALYCCVALISQQDALANPRYKDYRGLLDQVNMFCQACILPVYFLQKEENQYRLSGKTEDVSDYSEEITKKVTKRNSVPTVFFCQSTTNKGNKIMRSQSGLLADIEIKHEKISPRKNREHCIIA